MTNHCKACNIEDFRDPTLAAAIADVYGQPLEPGKEDRKYWEVGMAIRSLQDLGAVREDAEVLGVGAGFEATVYHLTRLVRRVFATDLYLEPGDWGHNASTAMLGDPDRFWRRGPWNRRRLVVQHMDALELWYEDNSFDGIFSSSSIEHFGDAKAVCRSAAEMCRVLKPGGICSVSTELKLRGDADGVPGFHLFSATELQEQIVGALPWDLADPLDVTLSSETERVEVDVDQALDDIRAGSPEWTTYPHVVLRTPGCAWTSVHLALRKRAA